MNALSTIVDYLALQTTLIVITDLERSGIVERYTEPIGPVFTLEGSADRHSVDNILNNYDKDNRAENNFLIYCSLQCILQILHAVNSHDLYHLEQGIMTFRHRWFIVVDRLSHLNIVEDHAINITNLSAMQFRHNNQTGTVFSAMWKPEGRRFEACAYINDGRIRGEVFPNIKYGLNGRRLKVTNILWAPFMSLLPGTNYTDGKFEGICYELVKAMATRMNFTFFISEPPDGLWGSKNNGSWNGMVRQLVDKTADIIVAPLTIEPVRATAMDFSYPYFFEKTAILYKKSGDGNSLRKYFLFAMPFKSQVWLCIAVVIPALAAINHFASVQKFKYFYRGKSKMGEFGIGARIWENYGIVCSQGMLDRTQKYLPHLVIHFWALTCVILAATYTGNLIAMLAVNLETNPFNSLEELIRQDVYKYGITGGTANVNILKSAEGLLKEMWENIKSWDESGLDVLNPDSDAHVEIVHQGGYAYMGDRIGVVQKGNENPGLSVLTINSLAPQYGVGLQKNSAYNEKTAEVIMHLQQNGLLAKWEHMYLPDNSFKESSSLVSTSPAITAPDLFGLFAVFAGLLLISLAIFLIEIWNSQKHGPKEDTK